MKIALISCVSKKNSFPCKAKDMYKSSLFIFQYTYAKKEKVDKIFILSAKYGLLEEDDIISPYNETLKKKNKNEIKIWSYRILTSLIKKGIDIENDKFIILAGKVYYNYIIQKIKNYTIPFKGLTIGLLLSSLKNELKK